MTDIITILLSFCFLIQGAVRGFMRSLIGPFSVIVTTVLSIIYFQNTKDMVVSLCIGLIGPLLLNLLLKSLLKAGGKAANADIKRPRVLSRLGGAALTLTWGWVFIIFTLILLAVLPPWGKTLETAHNDVINSASYNLIAKPWGKIFFAGSKQNTAAVTGETSGNDVMSLAQDPRFQQIMQDPEIQKEIDAHDIAKLMSNPKMMALVQKIMSDPATMKKVMALYSSQAQPQANTNP